MPGYKVTLNALLPFWFILINVSVPATKAGSINFNFPTEDGITKLYGDAYIQVNTIRLTKNNIDDSLQASSGWVTCSGSIPMWHNSSGALANFTSHFRFMINKGRTTPAGDGITFFMAPVKAEPPDNATGQWLGLFNGTVNGNSSNQIVAVEFDTFRNTDISDPDDNHVGIDVNSVVSLANASVSQKSPRPANESLNNPQYWDAWVDYNGVAKQIQVFLLYNPSGDGNNITKPGNPILSYEIDLTKFVPENVKVGFSASTGLSDETHTIYYWNFSSQYSWEISKGNGRSKSISIAVVLVSVFASLLGLCGFIFFGLWWCRRKRMSSGEDGEESDVELDERFAQGPRKFSYAELRAATRNFSDDEKLGQGGFGGVYRGILSSTNEVIAVKRVSEGSQQGRKEYVSEVTIISQLRHRNLVQLLGWCHKKGELLLVYEFLPNGSLDKYLFGKENDVILDWDRRYRIACDIASALVYLHDDWEQRVLHRDVKSSNVMLDSEFNAKLGDFGLARLVGRDHDALTTMVAGTFGYLAPECFYTGKATTESDVFSFGAVALEIACGRRPTERISDVRLVEWVWSLYGSGMLFDSADQKLDGNFKADEIERLLLVGLLCSHYDPQARPKMRDVVKILKFEAQMRDVPLKHPVAVYDNPLSFGYESRITNTSASSSSLRNTSSSLFTTGSGTGFVSKPLLFHTDDHLEIESR